MSLVFASRVSCVFFECVGDSVHCGAEFAHFADQSFSVVAWVVAHTVTFASAFSVHLYLYPR